MSQRSEDPEGGDRGSRFQLNLVGFKQGGERPAIAVTAVDGQAKALHVANVDGAGHFDLPEEARKAAQQILIGPATNTPEAVDPESILRYRPEQFDQLLRERVINISQRIWEKWFLFLRCTTGTVQLCRRSPWWFDDLLKLATTSSLEAEKLEARSRMGAATSLPELIGWPFRCQVVCNGIVEIYRRTCCCQPWIIDDPRIPELIRELEEIVRGMPDVPPIPNPNPPDPFMETTFFKEGALDERALNAHRDLAAMRVMAKADVSAYINARPYLLCRRYSCGRPQKVGEGFINPDGRFNICWLDTWRINRGICHDEYAYIVKQVIGGLTFTIYNGVAANIWYNASDEPELTSYSRFAYGCRDNGQPGSGAYVFLDLIGDTESWQLKTPNATGWDRVGAPAYNDGLVFPAVTAAAAVGANLNRNWGGTLKLNYTFSEDMRNAPVAAKYYRISVSEADSSGHPTGARSYLFDGLSWQKSVPNGTGVDIVPVVLGPFSQGGEDNLYLIPYDADADWNAGQYHGYLHTNDPRWNDPAKRHLLTLEVFDAAGRRLRPTAAPPTGLSGSEGSAPFTFRRRFQDLGPTADVPFAALTHMLWWDNQALGAAIVNLQEDGLIYNEECLFLQGTAGSTFGIGYRAYHPNEQFQLAHSISWQRGIGGVAGSTGVLLGSSSTNVGVPPSPAGSSPTNTFAEMLRTDLDPTRKKCAFTVFLSISSKTTDGDYLGNGSITTSGAFALEID